MVSETKTGVSFMMVVLLLMDIVPHKTFFKIFSVKDIPSDLIVTELL